MFVTSGTFRLLYNHHQKSLILNETIPIAQQSLCPPDLQGLCGADCGGAPEVKSHSNCPREVKKMCSSVFQWPSCLQSISHNLLFRAECYSIIYTFCIWFICYSTKGHSGCFNLLWIPLPQISTGMRASLGDFTLICLDYVCTINCWTTG